MRRISMPCLPEVSVEEILANSFRDFHCMGFDYICLRRSPRETVKLYFFDGDVSKLPEIVNPHDHRYDFSTTCIAGRVDNIWYCEAKNGQRFQRFAYDTPLLGGLGFTWVGETKLSEVARRAFKPGGRYSMLHSEIHTIRMVENESVICLTQYEDLVRDRPTLTFTRDREPPSLDGLYNRFTADQVLAKLSRLKERVPSLQLPKIT